MFWVWSILSDGCGQRVCLSTFLVFRSMTFFVECQFFRLDRRCPFGGGVGVDLLRWDFGSSVAPSGTALRNGKHEHE